MYGNGGELYCNCADPMLWENTDANLRLQPCTHTYTHARIHFPSPLVCFMHLQTSVTLIDTLWNSLKPRFHMKKNKPRHEGQSSEVAVVRLRNQKLCKIIICCTAVPLLVFINRCKNQISELNLNKIFEAGIIY